MAEKRGSRRSTSFDFFGYIDGVRNQQERLRDNARNEDHLASTLGRLVIKVDNFLATKNMLGREVALGEEGLENCLLAYQRNDRISLKPIELEDGEDELIATYQGVHLHEETFGISGLAGSRLYIAHRLVVDHESFHHPLLTSYYEQSALLPLEDTDCLEIIES